ncbi:MAG: hypothetical protein U0X91_30685 [Spirosomataceae bacterium]
MENVIKVLDVPVTVKVVYLDKKMLSMAFFRQIQYWEFFDFKNKKPKGTAIGYVKYYWKDNEMQKGFTYHVLWTDGENLYRGFLPNRYDSPPMRACWLETLVNRIQDEESKEEYKRIIEEIIEDLEHIYIGS